VWVPGEEEVEQRFLAGLLRPWHAAYAERVEEQRAHPEEQYRREMEAL
jgi:hypothetical protein